MRAPSSVRRAGFGRPGLRGRTAARTGDQPHPVFCLCHKRVLPGLTAFLESGGRKIDTWYSALQVVEVSFNDNPDAFSNINTANELAGFEADRGA